ENKGAAFSLFQGKPLILIVFTFFAIILCCSVLFFNLKGNKLKNIGLLLIISGGIGNLIDRIFFGYVVDFIEPLFVNFAVFNFADIFITSGAFIILLYEIIDFVKEKSKKD
ncbi:MAG: signal peptidase II, partial [Clostridiales bacterium]|nr:signal peptidase II [Clostridiales bacterium]